ncbi:MAG: OLD family endonuclease [Fusobacteriales bacterium]|nr:MAG: OLD family endonuclease [Fusobacteriales bacterium]
MEIKKFIVKNWHSFSRVDLEWKKFLNFIGESNSGKSSLMNALLFFFQLKNFDENNIEVHIKDKKHNLKMILIFEEDKKSYALKIDKAPNEKIKYLLNINDTNWNEISVEEFKNKLSTFRIFYLPAMINLKYLEKLFFDLWGKSKVEKVKKYYEIFEKAKSEKFSMGYYRKLFLEFLDETSDKDFKNKEVWNNTILIWEKPEFYFKPQEERACYETLKENSNFNLNVIISTNSSRFIELEDYKNLCIFRKTEDEIQVYQYKRELFYHDEVSIFNMNYWINPDRSELFFAKKVILVEGQTDKIVLSYLAKKIDIYNYDYSIIECGSKSTIPQFIKLLNAFRIPYVAVYDRDNHKWRNKMEIENSNIKNKRIQRLVNKKIGKFVEFKNDIEEEIYEQDRERKNYKNKPFYALEKVMEKNYEIPKSLEKKLREIYK